MEHIKIENIPIYNNEAYENEIEDALDLMINNDAYLMSNIDSQCSHGQSNIFNNTIVIDDTETPENRPEELLGPNEKKVLQLMLDDRHSTVAYMGEMGSGKSRILEYIYKYLIEHHQFVSDASKFHESGNNFIKKIDINKEDKLRDEDMFIKIKRELFQDFYIILNNIYQNEDVIESFCAQIINNRNDIDKWEKNFYAFFQKHITSIEWSKKLPSVKSSILFQWIDDLEYEKFDLLKYLLQFYFHDYVVNGVSKKTILILDNVDSLPERVQGDFLTDIIQLSDKTKLKIIVAMRITTSGTIDESASRMFKTYQHIGVKSKYIIQHRINYFLSRKEDFLKQNLTNKNYTEYINAFIKRLELISNYLSYDATRITNVINNLSGVCIRRSLFILQRPFYNNIIKWDNTSPPEDMLIQTLFIGTEKALRIAENDRMVTNLFSSNGSNSLLKLRILQVLSLYLNDNNISCSIGNLLRHINSFNQWTQDEIYNAFTDLMDVNKGLISVYGVRKYSDLKNFIQSNHDYVTITKNGYNYFYNLTEELQYLQNCFYSLRWSVQHINNRSNKIYESLNVIDSKNESKLTKYLLNIIELKKITVTTFIPKSIDHNDIINRFSFVREALNLFLLEDLYQTINYLENSDDSLLTLNKLLTKDIINKLNISIQRILKNGAKDIPTYRDEITNWENLNLMVNNWNEVLFNNEEITE